MTTKTSKKEIKTKKMVQRNRAKAAINNRITEVVYESVKGFYEAGAITKKTMREFDALCLPKVPIYSPKQVKAIRERCNASQRVFAAFLNISPSSLQKWETGARKPDSVACKLLNLVEKKGLEALLV
jgi:putative transcriptional regulator